MIEILQDTMIVRINQEVDHHNATQIREKVENIYLEKKLKNIIFDFSKVYFMDSSGIGMCIGRYKLAKACGGSFIACNLTNEVKRIFDMAGLGKIINIYEDVDTALDSLA